MDTKGTSGASKAIGLSIALLLAAIVLPMGLTEWSGLDEGFQEGNTTVETLVSDSENATSGDTFTLANEWDGYTFTLEENSTVVDHSEYDVQKGSDEVAIYFDVANETTLEADYSYGYGGLYRFSVIKPLLMVLVPVLVAVAIALHIVDIKAIMRKF